MADYVRWEKGNGDGVRAILPDLGEIAVSEDRNTGGWQVTAFASTRHDIATRSEAQLVGIRMARRQLENQLAMLDAMSRDG